MTFAYATVPLVAADVDWRARMRRLIGLTTPSDDDNVVREQLNRKIREAYGSDICCSMWPGLKKSRAAQSRSRAGGGVQLRRRPSERSRTPARRHPIRQSAVGSADARRRVTAPDGDAAEPDGGQAMAGAPARSDPRIHVVQATFGMGIGGMERVIMDLCRYVDPARFRFTVCCISVRGALADQLEAEGVPVIFCENQTRMGKYLRGFELGRILREQRADILHTHNTTAFIDGLVGARIARRAGDDSHRPLQELSDRMAVDDRREPRLPIRRSHGGGVASHQVRADALREHSRLAADGDS